MMIHSLEPLSKLVVAMMYFSDVVFAVTGALKAARHRMDILGCSLVVRGIAIVLHVHLGPPGEFLQIGDSPDDA
jgi:hypothetical protein